MWSKLLDGKWWACKSLTHLILISLKVTKYFEENNLVPDNQHGFRAKRSTMTAWSDIQHEWASNKEEKKMSIVLLWYLSAAFDFFNPLLLCKKLRLYIISFNQLYNIYNSKWVQLCTRKRVRILNNRHSIATTIQTYPTTKMFYQSK